ncbi:conserved hypothetical protein [Hyphomicrobiales bacterium]|nr:conserved hypothetical protein [Hyphomicrobiales bacterium]CAH1664292.1 conserved hypothetical protein [Hyphomicrobiales bacterium]
MIAWPFANWRLIAAAGIFAVLAYGAWEINDRAYDRGYAARVTEETTATKERTNAANRADDAARRCAADPGCRLQNDGYRRD